MTGQLELNSRAELCRQLAKREPANRTLWMAEAENWSRLSKERKPRRRRRKDQLRHHDELAGAVGSAFFLA